MGVLKRHARLRHRPAGVSALPIQGSRQLFPVRRIFCVGRNYAEHAIEMGGDPTREPPFYFTKPADALVVNGADMPYPPAEVAAPRDGAGGRDRPAGADIASRTPGLSGAIAPAST